MAKSGNLNLTLFCGKVHLSTPYNIGNPFPQISCAQKLMLFVLSILLFDIHRIGDGSHPTSTDVTVASIFLACQR
jgi:hypothetical protein